ncbi:MAG: hypothetical protein VX794_01105 [Nitrospinota bacterium]|nr:hypothetical protein [Nitrospinota bacterium]
MTDDNLKKMLEVLQSPKDFLFFDYSAYSDVFRGMFFMLEKDERIDKLRLELQEFIAHQRVILERLQSVEDKLLLLDQLEVHSTDKDKLELYDYQINMDEREYTISDVKGKKAKMISKRNCSALRDLSDIRSRCHTGTGDRSVVYKYRTVNNGSGECEEWREVEFKADKMTSVDSSVCLSLPVPLREGDSFEIQEEIHLLNTFNSRNEWVTLVVEYPTESFKLSLILPFERKPVGVRREESDGASNSFNKRRLYPNFDIESNRIVIEWEERSPVLGRAYTMFWDW